jgi:hypothetical protein
MMAAERGQGSSRKRAMETAQTERSDSEDYSPAVGQGEMESSSEHSEGFQLSHRIG